MSKEEYLGGLMDATGEICRWAVNRAAERNVPAVHRACAIVEAIAASLLMFDWRNGNLRRKYDGVRCVRAHACSTC